MNNFVDKIIKFRWVIAMLIPLITVMMASSLKNLEFEGSYRIWFGEESKILKDYDNFRAIFGNDDVIAISLKVEEGVFNKDTLQAIDNITKKLWETEYIARVDSITNYQYVHADEEYPDEIIVEDFIENIDSLSEADLELKKKVALEQDLIVGKLISADATTTMIVGRMTPKAGDDPEVSFKLRDAVLKIIEPEVEKYGYTFYLSGGPIINTAFIEIAQHDGGIFTPAVILVAMFLLLLVFRKFSLSLLSIAVVIFTFLIVLSIQVILGFKLNNFTANIPVFVVAIGIADAMHLVWIYIVARKMDMDNYEAIHYSVSKNFLALLLTSLTTAVGFASLSISKVIPIQTLGIATASAAVLAFILTILFVPALLAILNPKIKAQTKEENKNHNISSSYVDFILNNNTKILIVSTLIFIGIGIGIFQATVDSNTVRYFKENVPFRASTKFIQDNLTGPMSYEIIVDSKKNDGIKDPKFLKTVEKFYKEYHEAYPEVRHISSLMDVVKTFNDVMVGSKTIPDNQNLIAQYLLLYSLSLPQGMEINDKMDINERLLRVSASINMVDTSKDLEMIEWAQKWWDKTPYSAEVNGQTQMFAHMQHDVTNTLIYSITLAVVLISIIMLLIFKNLRMLPLFIAPNILPIALVVGVMGWLDIDIDMGVAIAGAIIIGVAVDDTIHFMVKYVESRKRGEDLRSSLEYVMSYAGSAIIFTTIILSLAFLVFVFSDFNPNYHFGVVTATALVIAVLVDLVTLPALLSKIDDREKSLLL
ncbi:MAG: putative RND superfamily exporter protein [Sulfurimonas sp.]|jgi:predicted RND superfamily exporter protein|uniref:efflux RND transporter permease subunit n=1 Tax=Sulfurimonas sp. TaxID=2022749 RepID=UPI0039E26DAB